MYSGAGCETKAEEIHLARVSKTVMGDIAQPSESARPPSQSRHCNHPNPARAEGSRQKIAGQGA